MPGNVVYDCLKQSLQHAEACICDPSDRLTLIVSFDIVTLTLYVKWVRRDQLRYKILRSATCFTFIECSQCILFVT